MYAVQNTTAQSSSTTMDARTISVAGDGAVSVGYSAGSLRISAPTQTVESQSIGMSNLGNTSGTTGIASGGQVRFLIVGGNNITMSQSLNGASGTLTVSAFNQTGTQFSAGLSNIGNTAGDTGTVAGRLVLAGGNNITLSGSTNGVSETITISAGAGGGFSAGASNLGNTAGNTGVTGTRLVLVGTNNISLSQTTDANGATLSINNTVSAFQAGASNLGNTAGDTGVTGTRLVLVGTNNISLSQTTGANGATLSISGNPAFSGGVSNVGNTGGATGVSGTRLVLVGSNNVTLSQTTDANGATVSMFGQAPAGGAFSGGASNLGNTAGNTGITGTQLVLVGTNAISLSQTTGANGGTLSIDAPATSSLVGTSGISISTNGSTISVMQTSGSAFLSSYAPYDDSPMVTGQQGQGTLHVQPMRPPGDLVMDRIALGVQISNATNSSNSITISQYIGVYTRNASSISLVSSISSSTNFTGSGTVGSYSLYGGPKWHTIPWTMTLTGGVDYFVGIIIRTTTGGGAGHSISQLLLSKFTNSNWSGILGAGSNATNQRLLGNGVYTATTAGLPANIPFASLNGEGSVVLRNPVYMLRSGTV
jgi:hypothetical protein